MRYVPYIFFIAIATSCVKPFHRHNDIIKVELAENGYFFDFGQKLGTAISVDSCLNFKYYNGNVKNGYYIGKVSRQFWDTLNYKLDKIKFKTIKSDIHIATSDKGYYELIVQWKTGKTRIIRVASLRDNLVDNTFNWLNYSFKTIKLQKISSPINFETTFQNSTEGAPTIEDVRFPPHSKN